MDGGGFMDGVKMGTRIYITILSAVVPCQDHRNRLPSHTGDLLLRMAGVPCLQHLGRVDCFTNVSGGDKSASFEGVDGVHGRWRTEGRDDKGIKEKASLVLMFILQF
jgi:hypothetical protein